MRQRVPLQWTVFCQIHFPSNLGELFRPDFADIDEIPIGEIQRLASI